MKEEAQEANKHSHKLTRANLHRCSSCGRLIATTYRETEKGELLIEEPELDLKIVSSRISESGPLRLGNIPIGTDLPTWS